MASQFKTWNADLGATTRRRVSTGVLEGSGGCKRLYVGRDTGYDYRSFLRFAFDWTDVGRIISATLTLYSDDSLGINGDFMPEGTLPALTVKRLTSAFSEGTNNASWVAADKTDPASTAPVYSARPSRAALEAISVDITAIAAAWKAGSANHGLILFGNTDPKCRYSAISEDAIEELAGFRPTIQLEYEYGATKPDVPANLAPSGSILTLDSFDGDFDDKRPTDKLTYSEVEVYSSPVTDSGETITLNGGAKLYAVKKAVSNNETVNGRFTHVPAFRPTKGTTYKWRARVWDNEGQVSLWTSLTSFLVTNTAPSPPTLTPTATSYATLDGILFRGTFADADSGNYLTAYEVQLSRFGASDPSWDDASLLLWGSGKHYTTLAPSGAALGTTGTTGTAFATAYGGAPLDAGAYYWRARVWDNNGAASDWSYAPITLTASFEPEAAYSPGAIQPRPKAPWRIIIRKMGVKRGPGAVVGILEDAKNLGASLLYNSPGEAHWTLPVGHPQASVIEPKQTHYAVEFRQGDGWREVFAGLVWDFDATDTDIVFYGVDYLGLLDYCFDERYDPAAPDKAAESGGSKYVTAGKNTVQYIINDQLKLAVGLSNSPVGFITVPDIGLWPTMGEAATVYSTYQPTLNFVSGLLDTHRAGTGKRSRLSVEKTATGYQFKVTDDPGVKRDNLRLRYGELVQGYRVMPFGTTWATRMAGIGRDKSGIKVRYQSMSAPGIDENVWGRFTMAQFYDGVADANDLTRRIRQDAVAGSKLGKQIAVGIRNGLLAPRDGYDLCDRFPVDITYGGVKTANFGGGYWVAVGITFTSTQRGDATTTLTLQPNEDLIGPVPDLLTGPRKISTQAEWQIGWRDPDPLKNLTKYWLNQSTGRSFRRLTGIVICDSTTGTR